MERIYRRTEAGRLALTTAVVGVAEGEYRRILGLINGETHFEVIRTLLPEYADAEICQWLNELEGRGLITSVHATTEHDLDFTGSFNIGSLLAAKRSESK